mmetsp:Transcript_22883/g.60156  ORF Transcript_22883/g.60156 Transcript_22883/m.60156 type:complete len:214 (+) Transcript_22883:1787-2428(+)
MIGNPHRGHSWTRALLGVQAREVHVCGSLEAMELVKSLAEKMGDDFELHTYERMTELVVSDQPLADYKNVRKGDCIVAFSRQDIFRIRESIERLTPFKCCVVYGQLPPETRSKQAHLFNNDDTGYDVLVASDAIGMGLNLNIRRVIFHRTQKIQDGNSLFARGGYGLAPQVTGSPREAGHPRRPFPRDRAHERVCRDAGHSGQGAAGQYVAQK